jgi:protein TonB
LKSAFIAFFASLVLHIAAAFALVHLVRFSRPAGGEAAGKSVSELRITVRERGEKGSQPVDMRNSSQESGGLPSPHPSKEPPAAAEWSASPAVAASVYVSDVQAPEDAERFEIPVRSRAPQSTQSQASTAAGASSPEKPAKQSAATETAAKPLGQIKPKYPSESRRQSEEGVSLLDVEVDAFGVVVGVKVHVSSGYQRLDASAVAAVKAAKFEPAVSAGRSVRSKFFLPVVFKLKK